MDTNCFTTGRSFDKKHGLNLTQSSSGTGIISVIWRRCQPANECPSKASTAMVEGITSTEFLGSVSSTTGVPWCDPSFACERFVCHHLIFGAFRFEAVEGRDSGLAVGQPWLGLERCLKGCYAIGVGHLGFYILLDRTQPSFTFLTGFRSIGFGDSGRYQFTICI